MHLVNVLLGFSCFVLGMVVREFVPSYFRKKDENLATKEDVAKITELQKAVEHRFNELLEESKQRHTLRLAALDRRLGAHQEAFALWRELLASVYTDAIGTVVLRCQGWWENNCLYLEPVVRDSFVRAYSAAHCHNAYHQSRVDPKTLSDNWAEIAGFPTVLFEAIQLPPINQADVEKVL
jgi:hypothetical protein